MKKLTPKTISKHCLIKHFQAMQTVQKIYFYEQQTEEEIRCANQFIQAIWQTPSVEFHAVSLLPPLI